MAAPTDASIQWNCWFLVLAIVLPLAASVSSLHIEHYKVDTFQEEYELPDLPFPYDALEPYIDAATVTVHHRGHHNAYMNKLNDALKTLSEEVNVQSTVLWPCLLTPVVIPDTAV